MKFSEINGSAKKGGSYMKLEEGTNTFRMVGGILPRYLYWVKNSEGKSAPFECLGFSREKERFENLEKDWVQEYVMGDDGKPIKCSWAYAVQVINRKTGKLEVLNLKKKMFEALVKFCKDSGKDPTDTEKGFDVVVDRKKTGAYAYNVDYELNYVKMMTAGEQPLSDEDRELIKELKPMEEVIPRPTSEEQKEALLKFLSGSSDEDDSSDEGQPSSSANEAINELDNV